MSEKPTIHAANLAGGDIAEATVYSWAVLVGWDDGMSIEKLREAPAAIAVELIRACPVEQAIHVIGGKWKLLLLRTLLLNGPQGYNQLLASVAGIVRKTYTQPS